MLRRSSVQTSMQGGRTDLRESHGNSRHHGSVPSSSGAIEGSCGGNNGGANTGSNTTPTRASAGSGVRATSGVGGSGKKAAGAKKKGKTKDKDNAKKRRSIAQDSADAELGAPPPISPISSASAVQCSSLL